MVWKLAVSDMVTWFEQHFSPAHGTLFGLAMVRIGDLVRFLGDKGLAVGVPPELGIDLSDLLYFQYGASLIPRFRQLPLQPVQSGDYHRWP